jgi:tetratricopeptide (TPR) repeat protein
MGRLSFSFLIMVILFGCDSPPESDVKQISDKKNMTLDIADYVGRKHCINCHQQETEKFTDSHHDLAMQHANSDTILGNFNESEFQYNEIKSLFYKEENKYFVRTIGTEGKQENFEIKYTFGVTPLQQYLIEFPDGKLQALSIAWDSRPEEEGGQRWFHLYPDENIDYKDELHWTGVNQNWNSMCAECHSTNFEKNYDDEKNIFSSTWSEIDVSCEACHGPGSNHIKLTESLSEEELRQHKNKGFEINFERWSSQDWSFKDGNTIASLEKSRDNDTLLDSCGRCHSRRVSMNDKESYKSSIHNSYILSLLEDGLYHPDGQINDEVYVYGSFIQSKMYQAGVNCVDCHDPHSLKLRYEGNQLCQQCHNESTYNSPDHHFHEMNTEAAECVSCHMTAKNYMVVDPRRDHSFRIPRPDLTIKTGSPNACNQCHTDQSAEWAVNHIKSRYGKETFDFHFAEALNAVNSESAESFALLMKTVNDMNQPVIARATALRSLAEYLNKDTFEVIMKSTQSDDALLKIASIDALSAMEIKDRHKILKHLLDDEERSIRIHAASQLAPAINTDISNQDKQKLKNAIKEYIDVQMSNAERAYANTNIANIHMHMGDYTKAEVFFKKAINKEKTFFPAYINLADLYRLKGDEDNCQSILLSGLKVDSEIAAIHHALGLSQVRQKDLELALQSFQKAALLEPDNSQFNLVYAIALNSNQRSDEALSVLASFLERNPKNAQTLMTISTINRDKGNIKEALFYAEKLFNLMPENIQVKNYVELLTELNIENERTTQ